jgi:hypothetical protein
MAKITISALGLEIPVESGSSIEKYFKNALKLRPAASEAVKLKNDLERTLDAVQSGEVRVGFAVEEDVNVGNGDTEWTIGAESSTGLQVWNTEGETVLSGDDFGEHSALKVPAGQAYVGIDFEGALTTGLEHELGDVTFGLDAEATISAANYRPFPSSSTTLKEGLSEMLSKFVLPGDLKDIGSLPPGAVATVGGSGSIKFAVKGQFSTSATPWSHSIPKIDTPITVKTGVSVGIGASAEFRGEYELRLRRLGNGKVTLGYYKKEESEFELSVSVNASASVAIGGTEVTERILKAISGEPKVDREFLLDAGLEEDKIKELEQVVSDGVDRNLEASLELGWGRLRSDEAAFLFTIDLAPLDNAGKQAVRKALDGDLRELTSGALPAGIELTRSVVRETLKQSSTIRLNLFGVFNYISVFELVQKGEAVYDSRTGDLQFLDEATAKRKKAWIKNTRAVDTEKISKLSMEMMLVSHVYNAITATRSIDVAHHYFEYHRKTKGRDMKDPFDVPVALGLLSRPKAHSLVAKQGPGRSALKAETRYDSKESWSLFVRPDGMHRSRDEFEKAGRQALTLLESGDEQDEVRKILGASDKLFEAIRKAGSLPNALRELSQVRYKDEQIPKTLQHAMYSDYLTIVWWADSMVAMDIIGRPQKASVQITTDTGVYHYDRSEPSAVPDALETPASG